MWDLSTMERIQKEAIKRSRADGRVLYQAVKDKDENVFRCPASLKKISYTVSGVSDLTPWGGGNGCIEMESFDVEKIDTKTLSKNINDNGFGVEKINGAICDVFENFEGTLKFLKTVEVGSVSDNTRDYHNNIY